MAVRREDVPVASIVLREAMGLKLAVRIHGFTAAEMGVPLVEIAGPLEDMQRLTIEQAEKIAAGLLLAARVARGEKLPTALDAFLQRREA